MSQYDNNLTGVLFVNDKQGNDKRPDWKGSAEIDGVHFWVSGWARESARGPLISLKLEKKEQQQVSRPAPPPAPAPAEPLEGDDIPF
jgi:hypothetical protein